MMGVWCVCVCALRTRARAGSSVSEQSAYMQVGEPPWLRALLHPVELVLRDYCWESVGNSQLGLGVLYALLQVPKIGTTR